MILILSIFLLLIGLTTLNATENTNTTINIQNSNTNIQTTINTQSNKHSISSNITKNAVQTQTKNNTLKESLNNTINKNIKKTSNNNTTFKENTQNNKVVTKNIKKSAQLITYNSLYQNKKNENKIHSFIYTIFNGNLTVNDSNFTNNTVIGYDNTIIKHNTSSNYTLTIKQKDNKIEQAEKDHHNRRTRNKQRVQRRYKLL